MLAVVYEGVKKIALKELPIPKLGSIDVLVDVKVCGICQTDYKAYTGDRMNWQPPYVAGHEIAGVVAEVGSSVGSVRKGDRVSISPMVSCGLCNYCRSGMQHYCKNAIVIGGDGADQVRDGGFAEFVAVPERSCFKIPDNISFYSGALIEPLAGSYKGMIEYSNIRLGEDAVIIGAGGMGLLLTMVASSAGAGNLIVVDINNRLEKIAIECGATHFIDAQKEDPKKRIQTILPNGPDIVFEAAGPLPAAELAYSLCRRGTRLNVFGVTTPGTIPVSPADIHFKEIRFDASFSVNEKVMVKAISIVEKGLVLPEKIISHKFPLERIADALRVMGSNDRIKVVIDQTEKRRS